MKENETLKYYESQQFNSENLKQYDTEGQKYFLGYLLRKGYDFNIINLKTLLLALQKHLHQRIPSLKNNQHPYTL